MRLSTLSSLASDYLRMPLSELWRRTVRRRYPWHQRVACPACWYDLTGIGVEPICPECGFNTWWRRKRCPVCKRSFAGLGPAPTCPGCGFHEYRNPPQMLRAEERAMIVMLFSFATIGSLVAAAATGTPVHEEWYLYLPIGAMLAISLLIVRGIRKVWRARHITLGTRRWLRELRWNAYGTVVLVLFYLAVEVFVIAFEL